MKANLHLISKRAKSFLESPQFFKPSIHWSFEVTLDESDKVLTVFHCQSPESFSFLFAEVLGRFSQNKKISELWTINFREIESFLRDENHLPAFPENSAEAESTLNKMKISLISSAIRAQITEDLPGLLQQKETWSEQTLIAKNAWAFKLISPLGWELILCEEGQLTITGTPPGVSESDLEDLLGAIFGDAEKVLPVKVVAV